MYKIDNLFAKIINSEIPCNKVYEDDEVLAFHDIYPKAPVHILIVPKTQHTSFDDFILADAKTVKNFFSKVRHVAHIADLQESGYRLITNHGNDANQTVKHFHVHILGKKKLDE